MTREQQAQVTGQDKENATVLLEFRVGTCELQLIHERLTPLLQKEMKHAINVYSEVLARDSDFSADIDLIGKLDALYNDIDEHWSNVFISPAQRAELEANMGQYEAFVMVALMDDYSSLWNTMPPMDKFFSKTTAQIQLLRTAASQDEDDHGKLYHAYVVLPLTEMDMNISHVSKRLCYTAAARQAGAKDSGHFVLRLIQECDWKSLAEALIYDRQLAEGLFSHKPINIPGSRWLRNWGPEMLAMILKRNEELKRKYFEHIVGPESYTISKHAADLLARHSSNGLDHAAATRTLEEEPHSPSMSSAIKDRLRMLADSLKLKSRKDADEKGALLHSSDPDRKSLATSSVWSDEKASLVEL